MKQSSGRLDEKTSAGPWRHRQTLSLALDCDLSLFSSAGGLAIVTLHVKARPSLPRWFSPCPSFQLPISKIAFVPPKMKAQSPMMGDPFRGFSILKPSSLQGSRFQRGVPRLHCPVRRVCKHHALPQSKFATFPRNQSLFAATHIAGPDGTEQAMMLHFDIPAPNIQ